MTEKENIALKSYGNGATCSQAVISAYIDEIGLDRETAYRLLEGFGGGFGGMQEVCGAFSGACAVISFLHSDGSVEAKTKLDTYKQIRKAAEIFEEKYGAIRCYDVLHGEHPKPFKCGMKVKDAVAVVEMYRNNKENGVLAE